jgi:hypothetical protein
MRLAAVLFFFASLSACRYDAAFIEVTVTGNAPATTQLACTVTSTVSGAAKLMVPTTAAAPLSFPQSFTLQMPTAASAQVTVEVSTGAVSASSVVEIHGNGLYRTSITLRGSGDMSTEHVDLAGDDLSGWDGSAPSDLSVPKGYAYARDVTIHRSNIGPTTGVPTLSGYPVPIQITDATLADGANGGHVIHANGADITFVASGATCGGPPTCTLASELESYNGATGALTAWVRVPSLNTNASLGTDTVVTMLYGNAGVAAPLIDPALTWDSDFVGVWHLATGNADSTSHGLDSSTAFAAGTGAIFGGDEAISTSSDVLVASNPALDFASSEDFSISLWVRMSGPTSFLTMLDTYSYFTGAGFEIVYQNMNAPHSWYGCFFTTEAVQCSTDGSDISDNAWHMLSVVRQGSTLFAYEDGKFLGMVTGAGGAMTNPDGMSFAGGFTGGEEEVRISSVARSSTWVMADYALLSTPSAVTIGAEHAP